MPIYEFFCDDCNTLFNFFSSRANTTKIPQCPKCSKDLKKQMSVFRTIGKAKDPGDDILAGMDENKMEQVLGELASQAGKINEDDPKQMAQLMRKFTEKSGLQLGDGMEEAISRLESGEDPDTIEKDLGNVLEGEDPLSMLSKKIKKSGKNPAPVKDEKLYEL